MSIKSIVLKLTTTLFARLSCGVRAYSPEGEDLILRRFFDKKDKGVCKDLGVHYSFLVSNSHLFYKKNRTGINRDPVPDSKALVDKHRCKDINLEIGVSATRQQHTYLLFNNRF